MNIIDVKTIVEVQSYFDFLYGDLNAKRDWQDIYGYLSRTSGYLTRNILREKVEVRDFIRSLSWLFALANKLDIDITSSFYKKFPGICPYCLEQNCCCVITNKKPKEDRPAYKIKESLALNFQGVYPFREKTFMAAVKNIDVIYPANRSIWHFAGPWVNCSKLFEEIAEIHEAISKNLIQEKSKDNIGEEFADAFAWLLSAWSNCFHSKNLDEEIINYFYQGCPVCISKPCVCDTNDGRIQGLVDAKKFAELRVLFEELEYISPNAKGDIKDLIQSLKSAEETQNESIANAAISEAESMYNKLVIKLEGTEKVTSKLASIGKAINYLSSLL